MASRSGASLVRFRRLNGLRNRGLGFLPGVVKAHRRAFELARPDLTEPVVVRLGDFIVLAAPGDPVVSERLILRRRYEKRQTRRVRGLLRRGDVFVDVGANIGYYALLAASIVGPEGRVVAIEPDPEHAALLERARDLNGFHHLTVHAVALSDSAGTATLHRNEENRGNQSLLADCVSKEGGTVEVETRALDDLLAEVLGGRAVDVLKIDVEGAEARVLAGADRTLERDCPEILLEYWPRGIRAFGGDPHALLSGLTARGYAIRRLARGVASGPEDLETVLAAIEDAGAEQADLHLHREGG